MEFTDLRKESAYKGVLDVYKRALFSISNATIIP
jgi:hypothetical protein